MARVEQDGTLATWAYDATYQLTRERRGGANSYDTTYSYDAAGNRILKRDNALRTTYSYDRCNQLRTYVDNTGITSFAFDPSGNQLWQRTPASGTTTNTWDLDNRLIAVARPGGALNTFTYNADGQRVHRATPSGAATLLWDDDEILSEVDQQGIVEVIYTNSPRLQTGWVSQRRAGSTSYGIFDPVGSTVRLADAAANVTDSYSYKAFGESLTTQGVTVNAFRYNGRIHYYDEADIGAYFLFNRYLYPAFARFASADNYLQSFSTLYTYANNNPLRFIDLTGRIAEEALLSLCGDSGAYGFMDRMRYDKPSKRFKYWPDGPQVGTINYSIDVQVTSLQSPHRCDSDIQYEVRLDMNSRDAHGQCLFSTANLINLVAEPRLLMYHLSGCGDPKWSKYGEVPCMGIKMSWVCTVPCKKGECENPLERDAVIYTRNALGTFDVHPGQMLLLHWKLSFGTFPACCVTSCSAAMSVTQLRMGWNCGAYDGPSWGLVPAGGPNAPCPEPTTKDLYYLITSQEEE